jgi:hypothetical protein
VNSTLGAFAAQETVPGSSGTLSWAQTDPVPPTGPSVFTPADGQSMSSQGVPAVSFPTFSPPLPLGVAGVVNGPLAALEPLVPDVLSALGVSIEGATLTSWPVVCSAPQLVH